MEEGCGEIIPYSQRDIQDTKVRSGQQYGFKTA